MTDTQKPAPQKPTPMPQHFISLTVDTKLDNEVTRKWYQTVRDVGPDGIIIGIEQTSPDGGRVSAKMIRQDSKSGVKYIIALARSLEDSEAEDIVMVWNERFPDTDFNIEIDNPHDGQDEIDFEEEPDTAYERANERITKLMHDDWMDGLKTDGWRYGPKLSYAEKMHPLMLPFEQLPLNMREPREGLLDKILNAIDQE